MKSTKKKLNPNARKWVKALRSGNYKQGKGVLCSVGPRGGNKRFCCLGVACDLFAKSLKLEITPSGEGTMLFGSHEYHLPDSVCLILGLKEHEGSFGAEGSLSRLNDGGASFATIADLIESQPEGLFV